MLLYRDPQTHHTPYQNERYLYIIISHLLFHIPEARLFGFSSFKKLKYSNKRGEKLDAVLERDDLKDEAKTYVCK